MKCWNCEVDTPDGAKLCPSCGAVLEREDAMKDSSRLTDEQMTANPAKKAPEEIGTPEDREAEGPGNSPGKRGGKKGGAPRDGETEGNAEKGPGKKTGGKKTGAPGDGEAEGGSKTGSSKSGGSKSGGSKSGGSKSGGSKSGGSKTGSSKTGGSKTGSSKTSGSKTSGSKTGGSKTGGSKTTPPPQVSRKSFGEEFLTLLFCIALSAGSFALVAFVHPLFCFVMLPVLFFTIHQFVKTVKRLFS